MKLICPSCGDTINASDIDSEHRIAKCALCAYVFRFPEPPAGARIVPEMRTDLADIPIPDGLEILDRPPLAREQGPYRGGLGKEGLVIRYRPTAMRQVWLLVYVAVSVIAARLLVFPPDGDAIVFRLVCFCFALVMSYSVAVQLVNSSMISIADGRVSIRYRPLPWPAVSDVPARDVRRLWVHGSKNPTPLDSFQVHAETPEKKKLVLVRGLSTRAQAEYLQHALAHHLGLERAAD